MTDNGENLPVILRNTTKRRRSAISLPNDNVQTRSRSNSLAVLGAAVRRKSGFSFLRRNSSQSTEIPKVEEEIKFLTQQNDIIEKYKEKTKEIILIQSAFRRYRTRTNFIISIKHPNSNRSAIYSSLITLCNAEEFIVKVYDIIQGTYKKALRTKKTIISIPTEDVNKIFFNTRELRKFHQKSLKKFKLMVEQWPITSIGYYLSNQIHQLSIIYVDYIENLRKTEELIDQYFSGTFGKLFLKNKSREHADLGITSFKKLLSFPTSYLIGRRNHCLDFLYSCSPFKETKEYEYLFKASSMAIQLQLTIEKKIHSQDLEILCEKLSKNLHGISENYNIDGRKFIQEAKVILNERKTLHLFLFSDILLITKLKGKKYYLLEEIQLSDITIKMNENVNVYSMVYYKLNTLNSTYNLNERKSSSFVNTLMEYIYISKTKQLIKNDIQSFFPSLSPFTLKLAYYIHKSHIKEGLFRVSVKGFQNGIKLLYEECKLHFFCFILSFYFV